MNSAISLFTKVSSTAPFVAHAATFLGEASFTARNVAFVMSSHMYSVQNVQFVSLLAMIAQIQHGVLFARNLDTRKANVKLKGRK